MTNYYHVILIIKIKNKIKSVIFPKLNSQSWKSSLPGQLSHTCWKEDATDGKNMSINCFIFKSLKVGDDMFGYPTRTDELLKGLE